MSDETQLATLKQQRNELRDRLQSIEQDYRRGLSKDFEDQAQELENSEVLEGIAKSTAEQLAQIEDQIAKLEH